MFEVLCVAWVFGFGIFVGYYDVVSYPGFKKLELLPKIIVWIIIFIIWPAFWGKRLSN